MKAVINTTPLISLAVINKLSLLDELFENVYIPMAVFKEATRKGKKNTADIKDMKAKSALELTLDEGEAEVIVLAQEVGADLHKLLKNRFFAPIIHHSLPIAFHLLLS